MPTFARSGSGKWHVVGHDGCRYGREFDDDADPDETVTATDIVAYEPPPSLEDARSETSIDGIALGRGHTDDQRLVLPSAIEESESDLCGTCQRNLESHQNRRSKVIADLKRVTTVRHAAWERTEHETRRACDWCQAHEETTWDSDSLGTTVCPACGRLFETQLGEPEAANTPDEDRLPETPDQQITPIVFGTTLPEMEYDPTDLIGSNRPLIKYREKHTYADVVFELERTGHGFTAEGIAAFEDVRADYAEQVAGDDTHQTAVSLEVGTTPRTITLEGILPADHVDVIDACWDVVSDPDYWFPLGWPQQGYIHRRAVDPTIPGHDPVVEEFPRLRTQQPSTAVDTETLRSITDPGRYQRGERYYEQGAVTDIERVDDRLEATVQGSRPYEVQATLSDGSFVEGWCDCPDDAATCKHIVAAVLASGDVEPVGSDRSLEAVLESASPEAVRELLRTLAADDISVRKRIYDDIGDQ